jgi:hypothetical protein
MTDVTTVNNEDCVNQDVLLQAWARLYVYDRTAVDLKTRYVDRRKWVIVMTLVATIASVFTGVLGGSTDLAIVLGIVAVALPIVGSYLMADVIQFTGTTDWIKYRFAAEEMRMHIYLYRMRAREYARCQPHELDNLLIKELGKVRNEINPEQGIPPSATEPKDEDLPDVVRNLNRHGSDDGLCPLGIADYVQVRIDNQRGWYNNRINKDFSSYKRFFRFAQVSLLIGTLVGAFAGFFNIQLMYLVAITNSISSAFVMWSDVGMVGKTFALFRIAANKLDDEKDLWLAKQDDPTFLNPETRGQEIAGLVTRTENVLAWERQEWYELALQSQAASDEMIIGDLKRLTKRADQAKDADPTAEE